MRIAVWYNLPSGGGKRALHEHVCGLLGRGHAVEVWCPSTADVDYLPLREHCPEHIVPLAASRSYRFNPLRPVLRMASWGRAMDEHSARCADEIQRGGFDVVFANSCLFFAAATVGRFVRLPKLLYLQEPCRWLHEARPDLPWPAPPPPRWWSPRSVAAWWRDQVTVQALRMQAREEVRNARAYDLILVNSLFSRESVLRVYGMDAQVCYLGIDLAKFRNLHHRRDDFIIGLGALIPGKDVRFAVEAVAALPEARPKLVWVANLADAGYLEEVSTLARSRGVVFEPRIRIPDREVVDLLNRAAVMVYAPRLEPFGLAPLEANACGLPVVAVAEGGVRETVVDGLNGLLVPHKPAAMAAAVQRLLRDQVYARSLGEAGVKWVAEKWSLPAATDRLEQALGQVVRKPEQAGKVLS